MTWGGRNGRKWSAADVALLTALREQNADWDTIVAHFPGRNKFQCQSRHSYEMSKRGRARIYRRASEVVETVAKAPPARFRTLGDAVFGAPPIGRSALDQRQREEDAAAPRVSLAPVRSPERAP